MLLLFHARELGTLGNSVGAGGIGSGWGALAFAACDACAPDENRAVQEGAIECAVPRKPLRGMAARGVRQRPESGSEFKCRPGFCKGIALLGLVGRSPVPDE